MRIQINTNSIDCEPRKTWLLVVSIEKGVIIGSCDVGSWSDAHPVIGSLHVHPDHRRKGHATSILRAILWRAMDSEKLGATLGVHKDNAAAIALYRRFGFRSYFSDETMIYMAIAFNQKPPEADAQPPL